MNKRNGVVILSARFETEGGIIGDGVDEIGPGWKLYGRTFEEWDRLEPGRHEVPADYDPDDDYAPEHLRSY